MLPELYFCIQDVDIGSQEPVLEFAHNPNTLLIQAFLSEDGNKLNYSLKVLNYYSYNNIYRNINVHFVKL